MFFPGSGDRDFFVARAGDFTLAGFIALDFLKCLAGFDSNRSGWSGLLLGGLGRRLAELFLELCFNYIESLSGLAVTSLLSFTVVCSIFFVSTLE